MTYSSNLSIPNRFLQKQNSLLLLDEEAKQSDLNDELLLPNSTRSLKRRSSLLEKSRDWVNKILFCFSSSDFLRMNWQSSCFHRRDD